MKTLLVFDPLVGRCRPICIECLDAWTVNGLDCPDADGAMPSERACSNCAEEDALAEDAARSDDDDHRATERI